MAIQLKSLSRALGAEVQGLDLRQPLDADTVSELAEAFYQNIVLVFRNQDLTQQQQLAFASNFGELGQRSLPPDQWAKGVDHHPAIMLISNIRKDGKPIGAIPDGELWFHHDNCYVEMPNLATFLYAVEVPTMGGNTRFANMYKAYDELPEDLKEEIKGRKALQIYEYQTTGKTDIDGDISDIKHYLQPVALTHPVTRRKALYVNPLMTARIEGMPRDKSDDLLENLLRFQHRSELIYDHVWKAGDLLMWYNYCSCHARTDFPPEQRRLMHRCIIKGGLLQE